MAKTLTLTLTLITALVTSVAQADGLIARYVEGTHYQRVPIPVQTANQDPQRVEVLEVFSYGCIHCYNFDPMVNAWEKTAPAAAFRRMPAVFNASWVPLAQAFYTAEALGVSEQMHAPLFAAVHDQPVNLGNPKIMAELFETHAGIDADVFKQAYESFGVRGKVKQAEGHGRAFRLRAVPSMVVDGKYLVDASMVPGGNAEMLQVVNFLVAKTQNEAKGENSQAGR